MYHKSLNFYFFLPSTTTPTTKSGPSLVFDKGDVCNLFKSKVSYKADTYTVYVRVKFHNNIKLLVKGSFFFLFIFFSEKSVCEQKNLLVSSDIDGVAFFSYRKDKIWCGFSF